MNQLLAVGVLALSSSIAMAGRVQLAPVIVTLNADGSGSANGNMAQARAAANDVEYIGCGVRKSATSNGVITFAFCQAADAAGNTAYCYTDNAELVDAIKSVADYSFVTFSWNTEDQCRLIGVSTQSFYIP
ncbi:MAG: hypothetical protein ABW171_12535 [Steroidobacter sp.]